MAYPFKSSPFNEYLPKLCDIRIEEMSLYSELTDLSLEPVERMAARARINELGLMLLALQESLSIPPRTFDVFLSKADLAVESFVREYPEPTYTECPHSEFKITRRVVRGGGIHAFKQCLSCGRQGGAVSTKHININALSPYDETLVDKVNGYYYWWRKQRADIRFAAEREGNEHVFFDHAAFEDEFTAQHPHPAPDLCEHTSKELRLRQYEGGGEALVYQCISCGKHVSQISKKKVPNWIELPSYDNHLQESIRTKILEWEVLRRKAYESAHKQFRADVNAKIVRGELAVRDNSKFGNYYDSEEWARTRKRILSRDDHKCQSCHADAECVHHIVYDRLGAENDLDLISLCNSCHELVHKRQHDMNNFYRLPPCDIANLFKQAV